MWGRPRNSLPSKLHVEKFIQKKTVAVSRWIINKILKRLLGRTAVKLLRPDFMNRRELVVKLFEKCNIGGTLEQLHSLIFKLGLAHDSFFATKLTALYSKHSSLSQARKVFDETPERTVYLWNGILRSYCKANLWEKTLFLFHEMVSNGATANIKPDNFTVSVVLKAYAGLRLLEYGKMFHGFLKKSKEASLDMFVGSALIELYGRCGQMGDALKVFNEFSQPDLVLWTSMISGYEQNGDPKEAIEFFSHIITLERLSPHPVTLVSVVCACSQLSNFKLGSSVHGFVIRREFAGDLSLLNSLLNLYSKTGSLKMAANLFRTMPEKDVISWSSMIACYSQNGAPAEAIVVFDEMIEMKIKYNSITVISALQACATARDLDAGKRIHKLAAMEVFESDLSVSTGLIDMYMKCYEPDLALKVFEKMPKRNVISWAALLSGYSHNGMAFKSMEVFKSMLLHEIKPDAVAMVKILEACSGLCFLLQARCLHGYAIKSFFMDNLFVRASLIELYSKCGTIENALKIFEETVEKDVVIWSSMIAGYGNHGQGRDALETFHIMTNNSKVMPNSITFLSLLSACSHAGLVEEGMKTFNLMLNSYRINPTSDHYCIIVDLVARAGDLETAMEIVQKMPISAGPHVWGALLSACGVHCDFKLGEVAAKNLFQVDPNQAGHHIQLSNIYAGADKWDNVTKLRTMLNVKGLKKMVGQSAVQAVTEV